MKKFDIKSDVCHIGWQVVSKDAMNPEVTFFETEGYKNTSEQMKEAKDGEILFGHRIVHTLSEVLGGKYAKKAKPKTIQYVWDKNKKDWVLMDKSEIEKVADIEKVIKGGKKLSIKRAWNWLKNLSFVKKCVYLGILALIIGLIVRMIRR